MCPIEVARRWLRQGTSSARPLNCTANRGRIDLTPIDGDRRRNFHRTRHVSAGRTLVPRRRFILGREAAAPIAGSDERDEASPLDHAAVLVKKLATPGDASGPAAMLLNLLDFGDHLNMVTEEDGGLELPLADADQGQRGDVG